MKKLFVLLFTVCFASIIFAQERGNTLRFYSENESYNHSVRVSEIDSINFNYEKQLQYVYANGNHLSFPINELDSVVFQEKLLYTHIKITDKTDAIVAEDGKVIIYGLDSIGHYYLQYGEFVFETKSWKKESVFYIQYDDNDNPISIKMNNIAFLVNDNKDGSFDLISISSDGNYDIIASNISSSLIRNTRMNRIQKSTDWFSEIARIVNSSVALAGYIVLRNSGATGVVAGLGAFGSLLRGAGGLTLSGGVDVFFLAGGSVASFFTLGLSTAAELHVWAKRLQEDRIGDWNVEIISVKQISRKKCEITYSITGIKSNPIGEPYFLLSFIDSKTSQYINQGRYSAKNGTYTKICDVLDGGKYSAKMMLYDNKMPSIFKFSNIKDFYMADLGLEKISFDDNYNYSYGKVTYNLKIWMSGNKDNLLDASEYGYYISFSNLMPVLQKVVLSSSIIESKINIDVDKEDYFLKDYNSFHAEANEYTIGIYVRLKSGELHTFNEQKLDGFVYDSKPKVETGEIVSVEKTSAVVKCSYFGCYFWDIPCGIEYGYDGKYETAIIMSESDGEQIIHLTELTPGKTYTYRAYYEINGKKEYGKPETFTTEKRDPIAITGSHYNETTTTATISCTYENVPELADCGYYISKSIYSDASRRRTISGGVEWNQVSFGTYEGTKTIELSDLMPDEEYEYYAYISVDNEVVATGEKNSFSTLRPSAFLIGDAKVEDYTTTIGYSFRNVPEGSSCLLVLLKVGDALENARYIPIPNKVKGEYTISELEESTSYQYFVRIEYKGRMWDSSDTGNFTTRKIPIPVATTGNYSNVTKNSATVSCTYENVPNGGVCGVEYYWNDEKKEKKSNTTDKEQTFNLSDLKSGTTYIYRAFIINKDKYVYADNEMQFTTLKESNDDDPIVLCPDSNHPHAIDLGLPSGTKWACCNVGASSPEQRGNYYAWGETSTKSEYTQENYAFFTPTYYYEVIGNDISGTSYDAASKNWGGGWHMPNLDEAEELVRCCSAKMTVYNGVTGALIKGKNGARIFLPCNFISIENRPFLMYWTSTYKEKDNYYNQEAYHLFWSDYIYWCTHKGSRHNGEGVRPVK